MSARCPPLAACVADRCCPLNLRRGVVRCRVEGAPIAHPRHAPVRCQRFEPKRIPTDVGGRAALYRSLQPRRSRYETSSGPTGQRRSCRRTLSLGRIASCAHPTQPTPPLRAAAAGPHGVIGVCPSPTRARHELRPCSRTVARLWGYALGADEVRAVGPVGADLNEAQHSHAKRFVQCCRYSVNG
jgi:hypothetical protein